MGRCPGECGAALALCRFERAARSSPRRAVPVCSRLFNHENRHANNSSPRAAQVLAVRSSKGQMNCDFAGRSAHRTATAARPIQQSVRDRTGYHNWEHAELQGGAGDDSGGSSDAVQLPSLSAPKFAAQPVATRAPPADPSCAIEGTHYQPCRFSRRFDKTVPRVLSR
jgi:hypothetical protein